MDLSLKKEKELNVFLNNSSAQGNYDKDKFFDLLAGGDLDLDGMGLTKMDLDLEFGGAPEFEDSSGSNKRDDGAIDAKSAIEDLVNKKKKAQDVINNRPDNDADYYLMVAFNTNKEKEKFLLKINCPSNTKYLPFGELSQHLVERVKNG